MAPLLLELLSEEIPARMQTKAAEEFKAQLLKRFEKAGIAHSELHVFVTPRRLTLWIESLTMATTNAPQEKRGPRVGAPEEAVVAFARSVGLSKEQLLTQDTPKGAFYFAMIQEESQPLSQLLMQLLQQQLHEFVWPKSMRWGAYALRWVRPLQHIMCLFDGKVLPLSWGHLQADTRSRGHRFMGSEWFEVTTFTQYEEQLKKSFVLLKQEERKKTIVEQMQALAQAKQLTINEDEGLLEEVTGLVEWPKALMGNIDQEFMQLPVEVLTTSMRQHQKYFTLNDKQGKLAPYFILISNIIPHDGGAMIVAGNEKVLRARLSDAMFFYHNDCKHSLETHGVQLNKRIYHAKLGTMQEKVARMTALARAITPYVPHADSSLVERAAKLSKADLATTMVGEFPELQGIMGYYYACVHGEKEAIANAIRDHYMPLGANDLCPTEPVSVVLALADKLDALVGMFAINERPTGSKDPFALRRAALGVIRIILEHNIRFPLRTVLEQAFRLLPSSAVSTSLEEVKTSLLDFFADRLKQLLRSQAVRHDLINAVFDGGKEDDIFRLVARVKGIATMLDTEHGKQLLAAYKRAYNIVSIEEKKDKATYRMAPKITLLSQLEERDLFQAIGKVEQAIAEQLKRDHYVEAIGQLEQLVEPINRFFDKVTVNCEQAEVRHNRLCLLSAIRSLIDHIANFALIET